MSDQFCAHTVLEQVQSVVTDSPKDAQETSLLDQFQAGVLDLMTELLHDAPTPEQLEAAAAVLWALGLRFEAYSDRGLLSPEDARTAKTAVAEFLTAIAGRYNSPVVTTLGAGTDA